MIRWSWRTDGPDSGGRTLRKWDWTGFRGVTLDVIKGPALDGPPYPRGPTVSHDRSPSTHSKDTGRDLIGVTVYRIKLKKTLP